MFKYFCVLLLFSIFDKVILVFGRSSIIKNKNESNYMTMLNKILVNILEECNLNLTNIVIYDDTKSISTFQAVSTLRSPTAVMLISSLKNPYVGMTINDGKIKGIILVTNTHPRHSRFRTYGMLKWNYLKNVTMIVIPNEPHDGCQFVRQFLIEVGQQFHSPVYYLCLRDFKNPVIFTYDSYGNSNPAYWSRVEQTEVRFNKFNIFGRSINDNICKRFSFKRTDPLNNTRIIIGVTDTDGRPEGCFNVQNASEVMHQTYVDNVEILKKSFKNRFIYCIKSMVTQDVFKTFMFLFVNSSIDMNINQSPIVPVLYMWNYGVIVKYDTNKILSHRQVPSTPLEKIADFFGLLTLGSLFLIIIIIFFVIWYKTKKNVQFACFDVLRLLINSGVLVPLDTLPMKIFFTMIFLYFIVFQALFNGHLAEFLTISIEKKNADSLKDLTKDRIKIIYNAATDNYEYDVGVAEILLNKTKFVYNQIKCLQLTYKNPDSACIALNGYVWPYAANKRRLYVSKKEYFSQPFGPTYRRRTAIQEQLDRVLLFSVEMRLINRFENDLIEKLKTKLLKRKTLAEVNFRPIKIKDLYFGIILWAIGMNLSILSFIVEIWIGRRNRVKLKTVKVQLLNTKKTRDKIKTKRMKNI